MAVARIVRVSVMMAVMPGPPERSSLHGGGAEYGKKELHRARSAESAVRKITVVEAGDCKHAQRIHRNGNHDGGSAYSNPYDRETRNVHADEGQGAQPVN